MNNVPSMPGMPNLSTSSSGEASVSQAPFTKGSSDSSGGPDVELNTPSHVEEDAVSMATPQIQVNSPAPANEMKAPSAPKGGIKVVATRKGFYNQMRYKEGDEFIIRSEQDFGEWMKCLDSSYEKKRLELLMKKKKAK